MCFKKKFIMQGEVINSIKLVKKYFKNECIKNVKRIFLFRVTNRVLGWR